MIDFLKITCRCAFGANMTPLTHKALTARFEYAESFYEKKSGIASWVMDRSLLFVRMIIAPWTTLSEGLKRDASEIFVLEPSVDHLQFLELYLSHNFHEQAAFIGHGYAVLLPSKIPWGDYLSHYAKCICACFLAFFDLKPHRYRLLHRFYSESLLLTLRGVDRKKAYVFHLIDPNSYLLAGFCRYKKNMNVAVHLSNMAVSNVVSRYFDIDCTVLLGTHVQEEEVRYLQEIGDFHAAKIVYTGSEYVKDFSFLQRTRPSVDIGFFSGGEWARLNGFCQVLDVERIRKGEFLGNTHSVVMMDVVKALADLSQRKNYRFRMYLHPYERMLLSRYKITPPFSSFIDDKLIDMDSALESSRTKIFEPFVAVTCLSSIIWERLDMSVHESFMCNFKDLNPNGYIPESLGIYRSRLFTSTEHLVDKIEEAMKARLPEAIT